MGSNHERPSPRSSQLYNGSLHKQARHSPPREEYARQHSHLPRHPIGITFSFSTMGCGNTKAQHRVDHKFRPIPDRFTTIEQVQHAVRNAGLESSNLILGVDFTKSNKWTGKLSYGGRSLHDITPGRSNPYEQVISVIGRTLEEFDDDRLIPAF